MALRPSQIPHCFIEQEAGGRRAQLPDSHVLPYHAQDRSQDVGGPGVAACGSALRLGPADHHGAGRLAGQQGPEGEGDPCAARSGRESARPCVFPQQGPSPADDGHFGPADRPGDEGVAVGARTDPARAHPHAFRHTYVRNCVLRGVPIPVLQKWLGHASMVDTQRYFGLARARHEWVSRL